MASLFINSVFYNLQQQYTFVVYPCIQLILDFLILIIIFFSSWGQHMGGLIDRILQAFSSKEVSVADSNGNNSRHLKVGTLNYCGIAYSPFQFYFSQYQKELQEISRIFRSLMPLYFPNFDEKKFKWKMGKVDKIFKKNRYSNMFYQNVGYFFKTFLTRQQFQQKWQEEWKNNVHELFGQNTKRQKKIQMPTQEQKQELKLYDFMFYHTLLIFVYKSTDKFQELIKFDSKIFQKTMTPFYEISFLDEKAKLQKFMEGFKKKDFDILFLQEYSDLLYKEMLQLSESYSVFRDPYEDSLLVIKKSSFHQIDGLQHIQESPAFIKEYFRWAQNLVYAVADNIIIISIHLSSDSKRNQEQLNNLRQDMAGLRQKLKDYEFIVGGDFNVYVEQFLNFEYFPKDKDQYTTHKKRTTTQAQFNKSQKQVKQSKDKILTTLKIVKESGKIIFLDGSAQETTSFIPSNRHPFDHFLVQVGIQRL